MEILKRALPNLSADQRSLIADLCARRTFRHGEVIIEQDGVPQHLFIIVAGEVRVLQRRKDTANVEFAGPLGPGDLFGEISFVDEGPASATVVADGDVEILLIPNERIRPLMKGDPELAAELYRSLLAVVAHRLRATNMHLVTLEDFA